MNAEDYLFSSIKESVAEHIYSPHLCVLYAIPVLTNAQVIVELGTGLLNLSTSAFISAIKKTGGRFYCVDFSEESINAAKTRFGVEENVQYILSDSIEAGERWANGSFDFLLCDTVKKYDFTFRELNAWLPHMSEKGIMALFGTAPPHPLCNERLTACRDYAKSRGMDIINFPFSSGLALLWRR